MPQSSSPDLPPGTWWWHKEPDGRRVLWPKMTLENMDPLPVTDNSRFRCVECRAEGTYVELVAKNCTNPEWYHGDIRAYRKLHAPMRCLGRDLLDGLPCLNVWIASLADGFAIPERCPNCGSLETEEVEG